MENITIFPAPISDDEIQVVFDSTYQKEYQRYEEIFLTAHDPARDKKYAAGLVLLLLGMGNGFLQASLLNKNIVAYYRHAYNLGATIPKIVKSIPQIAEDYKKEKIEFKKRNKSKLRLSWKYSNGILPGLVLYPPKNNKYFWGSLFEDTHDLYFIARELANLISLSDYVAYLKGLITEDNNQKALSKYTPELKDLQELKSCLENYQLKKFFTIVKNHFANIPYYAKSNEALFHYQIAFLLGLFGCNVKAEDITNNGRIDCVIETFRYIYIVEFKEKSADKAIQQIKNRKYYQKFQPTKKTIYLLGVAFDNEERNITQWKSEKLDS